MELVQMARDAGALKVTWIVRRLFSGVLGVALMSMRAEMAVAAEISVQTVAGTTHIFSALFSVRRHLLLRPVCGSRFPSEALVAD